MIHRFFSFLIVASGFLFAAQSQATIESVVVSPANLEVNINEDLLVNAVWTVTLSENNALSPRGEYYEVGSDGSLLQVNMPLNVLAPTGTTVPQAVMTPETLSLSQSQLQMWWMLGVRDIEYIRVFRDGDGSQVISLMAITLVDTPTTVPPPDSPPSSPPPTIGDGGDAPPVAISGQALDLTRLELRFSDFKNVKFVDRGDQLHALLEVSYRGNGLLRGEWQIADPATSSAQPVFRVLHLVNQQLSDFERTEIRSPALPTELSGRYYLRFCVSTTERQTLTDTEQDLSCPSELISTVVGYQVLDASPAIIELFGLQPNNSAFDSQTPFQWPEVRDAAMYQLQILAFPKSQQGPDPQLNLLTGLLLPAGETKTLAGNIVLSKLTHGEHYFWRIVAFRADGEKVAQSQMIPIQYLEGQTHGASE